MENDCIALDNPDESRRNFLRQALSVSAGVALLPVFLEEAEGQTTNLFANPPEIVHKSGVLRGVIQLSDADRIVTNSGSPHLRLFQGWDLSQTSAKAAPPVATVAPGPTLRARVGGKVQLMLLNKIDDSKFPFTMDTAEGNQFGCDASTTNAVYPSEDVWPDCFHGSSTCNLHFHGTHTDPNGTGDNVLVQVVPDTTTTQAQWSAMFAHIFRMPHPPKSWKDMPEAYQLKQLGYTVAQLEKAKHSGTVLKPAGLVGAYDAAQAKKAIADKRPEATPLWQFDIEQVLSNQWPQYMVGAFPNYLELPEYKAGGPFLMGQAPGTFWYHAHKHGSTSIHIFNGLAGAMIVEGDYDDKLRAFFGKQLPAGRHLTERVMVFQQITSIQNLLRTGGDNARQNNNQKLINGQLNTILSMQPGEIQLWRLINAMGGGNKGTILPSLFANLISKGFEVRQVACDGVQFAWENYRDQPFLSGKFPGGLTIAAGNRADILVKAPSSATTARFSVPGDSGTPTVLTNLFVIEVAPAQPAIKEMHFFEDTDKDAYPVFPSFLSDLEPQTTITKSIEFSWNMGDGPRGAPPGVPPHFMLNGMQFGENKLTVDECMPLNDTQDWELTNTTGIPHPFHIHINPFQIVEIDTPSADKNGVVSYAKYTPGEHKIWQDVINIPPAAGVAGSADPAKALQPGRVRIRHKFADFTGTYVLHCHILAHEDRGMMQLVRVVEKNNYPAGCKLEHTLAHH